MGYRFKDFNIKTESKSFVGEKIQIIKLFNTEIKVVAYKIEESKKKENTKYLTMQIEKQGMNRVVFTGSTTLMKQIEKASRTLKLLYASDPYIDFEKPNIEIEYFGDYSPNNPGYVQVIASDNWMLLKDPSGNYSVDPNKIGEEQVFVFIAIDAFGHNTTIIYTVIINGMYYKLGPIMFWSGIIIVGI